MMIDIDEAKEALGIMCERCVNHEMCQETGCYPKEVLNKLIKTLEEE